MTVFRYKPEIHGIKNEIIWRPVADIYLRGQNRSWFELHPYIDSGADVTMIPLSFGKLLGLSTNKSEIKQIGGIRGSVPVTYRKLPMKIGDYQMNVNVAWALIEEVPPLLGRTDIFDKFDVTFKQTKRIVEFTYRI
jgi:hypothetical protein